MKGRSRFRLRNPVMSILHLLCDPEIWERFYEYKTSLIKSGSFTKELRDYIDSKSYLPVCRNILQKEKFPLPKKAIISKLGSDKKRVVYTYPYEENIVLKLLTFLLLRKYDEIFEKGLYSFRPGKTAKDAVRYLIRRSRTESYYYKVDIHDYFNSVPIDRFLPILKNAVADDPLLYEFLASLLSETKVIFKNSEIEERKGIMAGTPLASFYANLYLTSLDSYFAEKNILYSRYSDDIIVFGKNEETVKEYENYIKEFLFANGLSVNEKKEFFDSTDNGFTFLGFSCKKGETDIAPATVLKLKQKMRRKARALLRWSQRNEIEPEKAAKAFIRIFNKKLLDDPNDNELTWSCWFFSVITTTKSLHEIDNYAQEQIRYIISERRNKKRFRVKYGDMKQLGYRNLVHEYYAYEKNFPK